MDNLLDPKKGGSLTFPALSGSLHPQTKLHLLAVEDIGRVVAELFASRETYLSKKISIAGDFLTVEEMKEIYQVVSGKKAKAYSIPRWVLRVLNKEFAHQLEWHNKVNFDFDLDETRGLIGSPTTLRGFLEKHPCAL
jgi:uncharacterized protein YbjT (DUF2867 family)